VIGASAVSFADQAGGGGVDRELLGAKAWGEPKASVRGTAYEPLDAVPGGPYTVARGGTVPLNGSGSKPASRITSYTWSFTSNCPGGVQGRQSTRSGATAQIVAICSTTATLTVSDGEESDSESTTIKVTGKLKDVDFDQGKKPDEARFPFDTELGTFVFGFNRCRVEWADSRDADLNDHWLHKPKGEAVDTKQVTDPGGPYDGYFYVTDHNLKVVRTMIINKKLLKGGNVYDLNDGKYRGDIKKLARAIEDHERIHGELVKKMLKSKKLDFLDKLAKAVDLTEGGLQSRADGIIVGGETELKDASSEPNVQNAMAGIWGDKEITILRPSNDREKTYTLARIGDR
jgi:hypothetical protein